MENRIEKANYIKNRRHGIAALLGFVFVTLFTIAVALPPSYAASNSSQSCQKDSSACKVKAELPREWKWKKPDISFDHMYPSDK